jgi:hypothetical protein
MIVIHVVNDPHGSGVSIAEGCGWIGSGQRFDGPGASLVRLDL